MFIEFLWYKKKIDNKNIFSNKKTAQRDYN